MPSPKLSCLKVKGQYLGESTTTTKNLWHFRAVVYFSKYATTKNGGIQRSKLPNRHLIPKIVTVIINTPPNLVFNINKFYYPHNPHVPHHVQLTSPAEACPCFQKCEWCHVWRLPKWSSLVRLLPKMRDGYLPFCALFHRTLELAAVASKFLQPVTNYPKRGVANIQLI